MSSLVACMLGLGAFVLTSDARARSIALPPPDRRGIATLERVLSARRSVRELSRKPIAMSTAAQLLWAAQGITSRDGRRTAPSAGALYPLELIVVASRIEGLPAGIYRYIPAEHSLRLIVAGEHGEALGHAALDQMFIADAAAVIVVAAVEQRTAAKYGGRAGRYVAFEAGCASENLLLEAVALGLGAVVVGAFDDGRVSRILHLGPGERPLALVPVGVPLRGGTS